MKTSNHHSLVTSGHQKPFLLGLLAASAMALSLLPTSTVEAHGYIGKKNDSHGIKSRAALCNLDVGGGLNAGCGQLQYEPQSAEYSPNISSFHYPDKSRACTGNFMVCGPADGHIASAGMGGGYDVGINEQTFGRWHKNDIKSGENTFSWYYKAGHPVAYKEFYITKNGWNPNASLTRESFELVKRFEGADIIQPNPSSETSADYKVNIPADRNGYHIVLATWKVADTAATFYQVVDANIDNDGSVPGWQQVGAMEPKQLLPGDKVGVRAFTSRGEQEVPFSLVIQTEQQGQPHSWTHALATALNASGNGSLGFRTGIVNAHGEVVPNYGVNNFYVQPGSDITQVMVNVQYADVPTELKLSGLQDNYIITDGKLNLHFNAIATGEENYTITAEVINEAGTPIAKVMGDRGDNTPHFHMALNNIAPGTYDIAALAHNADWEGKAQAAHRFTVVNEAPNPGHDFVFPQGLDQYTAGTKVLQPKDGKVYECKPFPYSGYCKQWTANSTGFEPGVGHAWESAWTRQ